MHVGYRNATLGGHTHQASAYGYAATQRQIDHISIVDSFYAHASSTAWVSAATHSYRRIVQRCAHALLVIASTDISIGHGAAHGCSSRAGAHSHC